MSTLFHNMMLRIPKRHRLAYAAILFADVLAQNRRPYCVYGAIYYAFYHVTAFKYIIATFEGHREVWNPSVSVNLLSYYIPL